MDRDRDVQLCSTGARLRQRVTTSTAASRRAGSPARERRASGPRADVRFHRHLLRCPPTVHFGEQLLRADVRREHDGRHSLTRTMTMTFRVSALAEPLRTTHAYPLTMRDRKPHLHRGSADLAVPAQHAIRITTDVPRSTSRQRDRVTQRPPRRSTCTSRIAAPADGTLTSPHLATRRHAAGIVANITYFASILAIRQRMTLDITCLRLTSPTSP
jgi:hypothetical protein